MHEGGLVKKIMIVSQEKERLSHISEEVLPLAEIFQGLKVFTSKPSLLQDSLDQTFSLLVIDTRLVTRMIFPHIVKVRRMGFSGPIVLFGKKSIEFDVKEMTANKNIYLLEKPSSSEQLVGIIKNCLNVEDMKQRTDQRFDVNEIATLQAYKSDFQTQTTICNISRSGVKITGNMSGVNTGDLLRLVFNFEKIQKERTMSARVVWKKENDDKTGEAGLEFVSQKMVYQYLLESAVA